MGAGLLPWDILVWANLSFAPVLPWAAIIMAAYLLVYWKYLQGRGWPESTARARLECLRATFAGGDLVLVAARWRAESHGLNQLIHCCPKTGELAPSGQRYLSTRLPAILT